MKKVLIISTVLTFLIFSCTKEATQPEITINEPQKNKYKVGETLLINVVATDAKEMHDVKVWLITRPQNDTLYQQKKHSHAKKLVLEGSFFIPALPDKQKVDFLVLAENEKGKTATARHSLEIHDH
jgi:hypothetical protein